MRTFFGLATDSSQRLDLKYQFEDALAEGLSVGDATKSILESEDYSIDDPDDTPVIDPFGAAGIRYL